MGTERCRELNTTFCRRFLPPQAPTGHALLLDLDGQIAFVPDAADLHRCLTDYAGVVEEATHADPCDLLGVRDASGRLPGRRKNTSPALENLRMDLPLEAGYVTTVEPGIYFIAAILHDSGRRRRFRDCVNWKLAEGHIRMGGVRIEDTVLVTDDGPRNLTADIPLDP